MAGYVRETGRPRIADRASPVAPAEGFARDYGRGYRARIRQTGVIVGEVHYDRPNEFYGPASARPIAAMTGSRWAPKRPKDRNEPMAKKAAKKVATKSGAGTPSGVHRKLVEFDAETWQAVDLLGRDTFTTFQELADEAFRDLLRKHERPVELGDQLKRSARQATTRQSNTKARD
jgi:hypothetical protein